MEEKKDKPITEQDLEALAGSTKGLERLTTMTVEELRERQKNGWRKKAEDKPPVPPTPEQLAYIKKVNDAIKADGNFSLDSLMKSALGRFKPKLVIPYPVSLEDCEKLYFAILNGMLAKQDKEFVLEDVNRERIYELIKYFAGYPGKLDPNRGIYLFGAVGRGKTYILHAFMIFCATIENKLEAANAEYTAHRFQMKNAKSIVTELAESKKPDVMKQYYSKVWCFDDLGSEDSYKLFGNDLNVLGDIVIERYQKFQQSGLLTHATSNVMSENWQGKYGDRVESRLVEMFNIIKLEGTDKRKI